jgi:hypothetical protein
MLTSAIDLSNTPLRANVMLRPLRYPLYRFSCLTGRDVRRMLSI